MDSQENLESCGLPLFSTNRGELLFVHVLVVVSDIRAPMCHRNPNCCIMSRTRLSTKCWFPKCLISGSKIERIQASSVQDRPIAHPRGVPIRNILYGGNCSQCLRAGGLMQRCHACGIDEAFQAMIRLSQHDIPEVMVYGARFLHRMHVGLSRQQAQSP